MEGLLDGTPILFREEDRIPALTGDLQRLVGLAHLIDQGVQPFAGFCRRNACHFDLSGRTLKRTPSGTIRVRTPTGKRAADQQPARETITEHLEAGRYADAIPLLETTLQLQPDDVQSLAQLGMVKSDLGELEEARRLLGRAVELDPTNGQALVSLGVFSHQVIQRRAAG
jgi:tetratricopeptide (TPR) repeat protein